MANVSDSVWDPLLRSLALPHAATFYPHGFALRVSSNLPEVIDAARESFGHFEAASDAPPVELEVLIVGEEASPIPTAPVCRTRRHLLMMSSGSGNFGTCDFEAGYAMLVLSPAVLRDPAVLRYFFLEACGLMLVCERHLAAVHAACVGLKGSGVLLCGASTAGKSTLAYACAKRGFTYVSDDGCFLVRSARDRIISGNCQSIRFRPSAVALFPELAELPAIRRANGKISIEVRARKLGLAHTAARCRVDHLVFLNRRSSGPSFLEAFPREAALAWMESSFNYGRDQSLQEQRAAMSRLMELKPYQLTYSDIHSAVDTLESFLLKGGVVA